MVWPWPPLLYSFHAYDAGMIIVLRFAASSVLLFKGALRRLRMHAIIDHE